MADQCKMKSLWLICGLEETSGAVSSSAGSNDESTLGTGGEPAKPANGTDTQIDCYDSPVWIMPGCCSSSVCLLELLTN